MTKRTCILKAPWSVYPSDILGFIDKRLDIGNTFFVFMAFLWELFTVVPWIQFCQFLILGRLSRTQIRPKTQCITCTKTVNSFQKLDMNYCSTKKSGYVCLFSYLDCRNLKNIYKVHVCHFVPKVVSNFLYEEIGELDSLCNI